MKFPLLSTLPIIGATMIGKVKVSPFNSNTHEITVALVAHYLHGDSLVAMNKDIIQGRDCNGGYNGENPADYIVQANAKDGAYNFQEVAPGNYR